MTDRRANLPLGKEEHLVGDSQALGTTLGAEHGGRSLVNDLD
jgi:hypothetical protein